MLRKLVSLLAFFILAGQFAIAQNISLDYYLPQEEGITYNPKITPPAAVLGHEVGEWHVTHDKLVFYFNRLVQESPRLHLDTIGFTYERRPLLLLTVTSPENHQRLEEIREEHLKLSDPEAEISVSETMPAVIWEGFSIHGNESSGANAALVTAYYLAAAQGDRIEETLDKAVILLDPSFNPDGLNRFAAWVNANKSLTPVFDPSHRELNEPWPRGRTNHYWFDLNRDWMPVQHPESQARIRQFHRWKPNILTDHHEMGTNSTFFFQPGIPQRTNPLTPAQNQVLTGKIGEFHARALDKIGSLYYTEESFDDFYYGKGSTYPDANGCIGILFEQASSRGHNNSGQHGKITFPFTIKNQFVTSLSTIEAGVALREDLLRYQQSFYKDSQQEARSESVKGFVVGHPHDSVRLYHFHRLLERHQVEAHRLRTSLNIDGQEFSPDNALLIPLEQAQYRFVKALFQQTDQFKDSLFYDVSAWTMPMAFGLPFAELSRGQMNAALGERWESVRKPKSSFSPSSEAYAYLMDWRSYEAPAALYQLLRAGIMVKVAQREFSHEGEVFPAGTLVIPIPSARDRAKIEQQLRQVSAQNSVVIRSLSTGLTQTGIDLGSPNISRVYQPQVLLLTGRGVSSYEAGEVWHLLDQRIGMPVTHGTVADLNGLDQANYSVIVMVNGNYALSTKAQHQLESWLQNGGTLILTKNAVNWGLQNKLLNGISAKPGVSAGFDSLGYRPYAMRSRDRGAQYIGGIIMEAELDLTHPLCYGYFRSRIPVFRNSTLAFGQPKGAYQTPVRYTENPLLSGYISKPNLQRLQSTPAAYISTQGRGRVVALLDNPNFRAFWYGTNRLFLNAVFMGGLID